MRRALLCPATFAPPASRPAGQSSRSQQQRLSNPRSGLFALGQRPLGLPGRHPGDSATRRGGRADSPPLNHAACLQDGAVGEGAGFAHDVALRERLPRGVRTHVLGRGRCVVAAGAVGARHEFGDAAQRSDRRMAILTARRSREGTAVVEEGGSCAV